MATKDTTLRRNHASIGRAAIIAIAALAVFIMTLSGNAFAQGFDLGQLLGGGGGGGGGQRHQQQGSGQGGGVSVDRGSPPYTGKFSGKQDSQGIQSSITAQFACYPAHDSDIPQANAFLCYAGGSSGGPSNGGPPSGYGPPSGGPPSYDSNGGPPPYGPPNGGPPSYGPNSYGPPNGGPPPSAIE
jgi:hypothetical protein